MQTTITAKHLQSTPAIEEYIHKKTERIRKHFDRVQGIYVILEKEPNGFHVEIKIDVERHDDFVANAKDPDLYACVDLCVDRAIRQITDYKEQVRDHKK
ncbi:MAG: ribosome-associated translation inhibitor RaiA [Phycisphaerae bacterium]|nr:ribosome-associated translation inhibitor RaiA [Phycisphaerae bacterium]